MAATSVHSSSALLRPNNVNDDEEEGRKNRGDILNNFATYNDQLLRHAIVEAGIWTQCCIMVELWVWDGSHLIHKGMWMDPLMHRDCQGNACPVCMLTEPDYEDYAPATPVVPGEGLPGHLWANLTQGESSSHNTKDCFLLPRLRRSDSGGFNSNHTRISLGSFATSITSATVNRHRHSVKWRDLQAIANDPHQPWNPRLLTIASLEGVKHVTAIPYSCRDDGTGIVLFMCQGKSLERIATESNEHFMYSAAQLIGNTYAIRQPWLTVVKEKRSEIKEALVRLKRHLETNESTCLESIADNDRDDDDASWKHVSLCRLVVDDIASRINTAASKARGAEMQPPPATSWNESFLTFVGVFWTLLILTKTNEGIIRSFGSEYEIILGPFGAFVTLLYCLSSAPASQPRNAIWGQTISLSISILVSKVDYLTIWMKQSLATALAVAAMAKLGLVHPPAGASALIFASGGKFGWTNLASLLIGNVLAILSATIINNWSDKRQYPSYWGLPNLLTSLWHRHNDDDED